MNLDRLKKALLVALSSDKDGEVLAALKVAKKQLASAGKDIHWMVGQIGEPAKAQPQQAPPRRRTGEQWYEPHVADNWRDQITALVVVVDHLRPREQEFILSICDQWMHSQEEDWQPSPRQGAWLTSIYERMKRW